MYLYFDRNGTLREIINDEALRQGNYGVNKMYVYVDDRNYSSVDVNYMLPDGNIVGNQNYDDFTDPTSDDNQDCFIPFNPKRDLRYFKYGKAYKFCIVDLEANFTDINGVQTYTDGPLSQAGLVHCSIQAILVGGNQLQMGEVNFFVEGNAVSNQMAPEQYLSLSNYQFLRKMLEGIQHPSIYVGTTTTGAPGTDAQVTNTGTDFNAVFNFTIPRGDKGDKGDPGSPGEQGNPGAAATIRVGSTTTGAAGTNAGVVNSGTSSAAVLDFTIPKGSDAVVTDAAGVIGFQVVNGRLICHTATGSPNLTIDANGHLIYTY